MAAAPTQGGWTVRPSTRFLRDYKRLSPDLQREVDNSLRDLGRQPVPAMRRLHRISPAGQRPQLFSVDVTPNKAYKISFELDGAFAVLRRVGTHAEIDRNP